MENIKKLTELLDLNPCLVTALGCKYKDAAKYLADNGVTVEKTVCQDKTGTNGGVGHTGVPVVVHIAESDKGEWDWRLRQHGGFRKYTGIDALGVEHTITVDERMEAYEPYCPACGKWNESVHLNFCPNCGTKKE